MKLSIYPPDQQGTGGFDGGKITEQKPIGFPHEPSSVKRVGPLFYWAWAHASEAGYIPSHPHQGFEIITYVVAGRAEHKDSLGTQSTVGPGGAQVMQTGSGVWHEEGFIGPEMEGFQIWFEPNLKEAVQFEPTYHQYNHEDFTVNQTEAYQEKSVLGVHSPIQLRADANMWDIEIQAGQSYLFQLESKRSLAVLMIRGEGEVQGESMEEKDFMVAEAEQQKDFEVRAKGEKPVRLIAIEVPTKVSYPLYSR